MAWTPAMIVAVPSGRGLPIWMNMSSKTGRMKKTAPMRIHSVQTMRKAGYDKAWTSIFRWRRV